MKQMKTKRTHAERANTIICWTILIPAALYIAWQIYMGIITNI